ncbi:RAB6-interacting golgin-like [Orbicella faveolata]|uniref:RAB6-interacting golgin-like n=2 Tax=Orbicella faveolata TaxID=48498 RepID=UPI0009E53131|nr:RAB6-interacting golgin-like [Orbicella faveolata]
MSSWAGFTDEELCRLRQNSSEDVDAEGKISGSRKKAAINIPKRQRPREKIRTRAPSTELKESDKQEGDEDQGLRDRTPTGQRNSRASTNNVGHGRSTARLDSREEEQENSSPECERRGKSIKKTMEEITMSEEAPPKTRPIKKKDDGDREHALQLADSEKEPKSDLPEIIDESDKIQAIELSALEKMQEKQKQIEQENKRKKAALQETIKQRYKRTQAEAHTLSLVQKELSHLDSLLSADVAILRDKIEESSREYLNAQKRYERAEKEFVEAKMDLHKKTEKKDLLTEHLYTIIRENELRKAKKLEELMAKLNVATDETLSEDKTAVLEAGSDESGIVQNSDISVPQEEKVNCELKPESNNSPVNTTGETAAIDESKVDVKAETMPVSAEQEVGVTA